MNMRAFSGTVSILVFLFKHMRAFSAELSPYDHTVTTTFAVKMADEVVIAGAAFIIMYKLALNKKKKKNRRWWITPLYSSRKSDSNLLQSMLIEEDTGHFKNFVRMSSADFEVLLNLIGPKIEKKNTFLRNSVPVKERLAITLRFLATGDSYTSLQYLFKVSKQLISMIVPEVCRALIEALQNYVKVCIYIR